jgi:uncharacterized protein YecT (DUF1311 family)
LAAVLGAGVTWAQARATSPCLDKAMTQPEITACLANDARAADKRLNSAYADLLRYLDPGQQEQLRAAQSAWLAFRDADCGFWGAGDFSLAATNSLSCVADLSNERAHELEGWPPNAPRSALQAYSPR